MWVVRIYVSIVIVVPRLILIGSFLVRNKCSNIEAFECGFDSFNVSVFPVSLRFFVFCIIFLVLDLELILISLTPFVIWRTGFILNIIFFLRLVTLRILIEWLFGRLSWVE